MATPERDPEKPTTGRPTNQGRKATEGLGTGADWKPQKRTDRQPTRSRIPKPGADRTKQGTETEKNAPQERTRQKGTDKAEANRCANHSASSK